jgi:hypothetical protein
MSQSRSASLSWSARGFDDWRGQFSWAGAAELIVLESGALPSQMLPRAAIAIHLASQLPSGPARWLVPIPQGIP